MTDGQERRVRAGVIGAGVMGSAHLRTMVAGSELEPLVVADLDLDRARGAAESFGVASASVPELLASDVEVVVVAVPSGLHAELADQVLDAGKDLLLEKPIEMSVAGGERLVERAASGGRVLSVVSQRRFAAANRFVHRAVSQGWLGTIGLATVEVPLWRAPSYFSSVPWRGSARLDGGVLVNQGVHTIDLVLWHLGPPLATHGLGARLGHEIEVDDTSVVLARLDSGALLTVAGTTRARRARPPRYALFGDQGSVVVEDDTIVHFASDVTDQSPPQGQESPAELLHLQHADVARAVRERSVPLVTGEQACAALAVALATVPREAMA